VQQFARKMAGTGPEGSHAFDGEANGTGSKKKRGVLQTWGGIRSNERKLQNGSISQKKKNGRRKGENKK